MYIDTSTIKQGSKTYIRYLLRESYREQGEVRKRTIANLSSCSEQEIAAIKLALRHKEELGTLSNLRDELELQQGLSVGAVVTAYQVAERLGIVASLGASREGKLALWQVVARVLEQGSRLSAVRLAQRCAAVEVLGIEESFHEDDLYANLTWLEEQQEKIEDRLFRRSQSKKIEEVFLYDVTSVYLEGDCNELADYGYNRDKKKGKKQLVVGLLCTADGQPLSIEVFQGNTADTTTFGSQVKKAALRFGAKGVTFVGDRGMIRARQIADLGDEEFHYITAITKPQIESLVQKGTLQYSFFEKELAEIIDGDIRYVLRRNPFRADELSKALTNKMTTLSRVLNERNTYLREHPKARPAVAIRRVETKIKALKMPWLSVILKERELLLCTDEVLLKEKTLLDGCYVLKTDLSQSQISKETVHDRYKDLALVEWAFRTSKTTHLEIRPVYVCKEENTRGHALVVMLAYLIIRELHCCWETFDLTVEEALRDLASLCNTQVRVRKTNVLFNSLPKPRPPLHALLKASHVLLPQVLPIRKINVDTRKSLVSERKLK